MMRLVLLVIGLTAATLAMAQQSQRACARSTAPVSQRTALRDFSGQLPIPDYLDGVIACNTPPAWMGMPGPRLPSTASVHSPWMESERELYQRVLGQQQVDILVVPFQIQGYGLDRIERALMTADLAHAIGSTNKYSVADPWLVARALGEGMRRIDPNAVRRLAESVGARKIIYGYVGHDDHHAFTLTLQLEDLAQNSSGTQKWQQDWRAIDFTDEQTPALKFHDMLPPIVAALPFGVKLARQSVKSTGHDALRIEIAPLELVSSAKSPVFPLTGLVTLGALSSPSAELSRERIFERALLTALNTPRDQPGKSFLESYAFFSLGRRPSALMALNDEKTPQAATLRAIIDGNLPLAEQLFAELPDSLERLLLQISLRELQVYYSRRQTPAAMNLSKVFAMARSAWQPFVDRRMDEVDPWSNGDPADIKVLLDQNLPEPGLELQELVQGTAVARATTLDPIELDLANMRHIRRAAEHMRVSAFGSPTDLSAQPWDMLWLLEGLAEGRIVKRLWEQISLQGTPESAMRDLTRYAPLLSGHPALSAAQAYAAVQLAQTGPDDTRASWLQQSTQSAVLAAVWDPGQNRTAYAALLAMGIPSSESEFMVDAYGHDYPRRAFWPSFFFGAEDPELRGAAELQALTFSSSDISPLSQIPPGDKPGQAGAVLASLGGRFTGNPLKPEPSHPDVTAESDPQAIVKKLRDAIKSDPEPWENYWALGTLLVESAGDYTEASRVFMSFPGFHAVNVNDPVALSSYAYDAGTLFYHIGQFQLAKPFYTIAADLDTGSSASMGSRVRLELIANDFPRAISDLFANASRYSDAYAYRDYLSFLHAFGQHDAAWHAFAQLDASFDLPQVWVSALVGHRMAGTDGREISAWLLRPEIRDARFRAQQFAPYFAVLWYATDRDPPPDLGTLVEELQGPPVGHIDVDGVTLLVPHPLDPKGLMSVSASPFRANHRLKLPPDTPIKSDLAYFADAYAALRAGHYDTAVDRFAAMADHYPIEGYPLGYFAYAAAKSGDKQQLAKYLDTLKHDPGFDYWLARAFFAGIGKDAQGARDALQLAIRKRPSTDYRPIMSEYQYAEACEWLYQETQDPRFVLDLLSWVRGIQVSQPTQAWPYAMEYSHAPQVAARTRALAMTRYLDPKSKRIQNASRDELRAADAWFRDNNPFRVAAHSSKTAGTPSRSPDSTAASRGSVLPVPAGYRSQQFFRVVSNSIPPMAPELAIR